MPEERADHGELVLGQRARAIGQWSVPFTFTRGGVWLWSLLDVGLPRVAPRKTTALDGRRP
jgi:hypothetical protein